jgi:hypothetical protein
VAEKAPTRQTSRIKIKKIYKTKLIRVYQTDKTAIVRTKELRITKGRFKV